jgi:subtilisin family serine protease
MARMPWVALLAVVGLALPSGAAADAVPGQVVVRFSSDTTAAQRADALDSVAGSSREPLPIPNTRVVDLPPGRPVADAVADLERDPAVRWAEPNGIVTASATPNDPDFGRLWGLQNLGQTINGVAGVAGVDIGAPAAWETTTGDPSVLVGVADTGVQADHPDLAANVRTGLARDFVTSSNAHNGNVDPQGHGTHVAGIIGAVGNNGIGVAGVDWRVGIVPLRVLGAGGGGTTVDLAAGLADAGARGLPVVNASLGGTMPTPPHVVEDAIAQSPRTLFVVAAGNSARDNDAPGQAVYPCDLPEANLICVASIDGTGALSASSNYGSTSVDLGAPGQSIESTVPVFDDVWSDDFSTPITGRWTTSGAHDNWGRFDPGDGTFALASSQDGSPYVAGTDSFATLDEALDLTGEAGCLLTGQYALDTAGDESTFSVERSLDGVTWTPVFSTTQDTSSGSFSAEFDADGAPGAQLRLHFTTAASVTPHTGVQVSGLRLRCVQAGGADYRFLTGTSMASPQVAGAAALLLARHPGLSTAELRDALLRTVTPLPALQGKTVTGGMLNVAGALAAIAPKPAASPAAQSSTSAASTTTTAAPVTSSPAVSPLGTPVVRFRTARVQRVSRTHAVAVELTSDQNALLTATGTVSFGRGRGARLRSVRGHVTAGRTTTLRLRLTSRTLRRLRTARRATARIVVRAGGPAGSATTRLRPVRLV